MTIPKTSLLITVSLAMAGQASANLITNPGFEDAIGPEWVSTIVSGDASKWTSAASNAYAHSGANGYNLKFGPLGTTAKAYVEQVLSGLTPGAAYEVSGWMNFALGSAYNRPDKYWTYIEALGGGTAVQEPAKNTNTTGWKQYTLSQTADAGGALTVRLYVDKYATTVADKVCSVYFDDISVVLVPEPASTLLLLAALLGLGVLRRRR